MATRLSHGHSAIHDPHVVGFAADARVPWPLMSADRCGRRADRPGIVCGWNRTDCGVLSLRPPGSDGGSGRRSRRHGRGLSATDALDSMRGRRARWWTIELPTRSVTEAQFRVAVRGQTPCVSVTARSVHSGAVAEGRVLRPIGAREWLGAGGNVEVVVEREAGDGVIECGEPIRPPAQGAATEVLRCSNVHP